MSQALQTPYLLGIPGPSHPLGAGGGGLKPVTLRPNCPQLRPALGSRLETSRPSVFLQRSSKE
jgi:hypothetical protein